jgi:hypothetical protein
LQEESKPLLHGVAPKKSLDGLDLNGIKAATTTERFNYSERNFPSQLTFEDQTDVQTMKTLPCSSSVCYFIVEEQIDED